METTANARLRLELSVGPRHRPRGAHAREPARARTSLYRAPLAAAAGCVLALALAACGGSRPAAPNLTQPARPDGFRTLAFPVAGVSLLAPRNWLTQPQHAPLVTIETSGSAVVALWRYPSSGSAAAVPPAPLSLDETALVNQARARGGLVRVLRARTATVAGQPAVVLDVLERIAGSLRRVISTHVYAPGAELVLEEYAPPAGFATVRREAFTRIARSLRLLATAGT